MIIDIEQVKGYAGLTDGAKAHLKQIYQSHMQAVGTEARQGLIPIEVKEAREWVEIYFNNGEWLHYYANGTWG